MIKRLVKMHFRPDGVAEFEKLFNERKQAIAAFEGCLHLELWRDEHQPEIFFTYSIWREEANLNRYRQSDFFKETWSLTKALFQDKAEAWSLRAQ